MKHAQTASASRGRKRVFNSVFPSASIQDSQHVDHPASADLDRARQATITFLALPDIGFEALMAHNEDQLEDLGQWKPSDTLSKETAAASTHVQEGRCLLGWYEGEIRRHFLQNFRDGLLQVRDSCFSGFSFLFGLTEKSYNSYFQKMIQTNCSRSSNASSWLAEYTLRLFCRSYCHLSTRSSKNSVSLRLNATSVPSLRIPCRGHRSLNP